MDLFKPADSGQEQNSMCFKETHIFCFVCDFFIWQNRAKIVKIDNVVYKNGQLI